MSSPAGPVCFGRRWAPGRRCIRHILIATAIIFFIVNFQFIVPDFPSRRLGSETHQKSSNIDNKNSPDEEVQKYEKGKSHVVGDSGAIARPVKAPTLSSVVRALVGDSVVVVNPDSPGVVNHMRVPLEAVHNNSASGQMVRTLVNDSLTYIVNSINEKQTICTVNGNNSFALKPDGNVLVFQVHNRDNYLAKVIEGLRTVRHIEETLVIFSHDFYSKEIFDLVRSIDFCPVLQMFYPYAMQLYPDKFPGPDSKDCPRNLRKAEAFTKGCINAEHPDIYGHYREAPIVQTKHHWWWKLNRVFDGLRVMKGFSGSVVFVEEDHYLAPDFIHVLNIMKTIQPRVCPHCSILSLGHYEKKVDFSKASLVSSVQWLSSRHNMAMSFNRNTFNLIKLKKQIFCETDDYNWDWTLHFMSLQMKRPFHAMLPVTPRAFHIGACGVHHKGPKGKCDPEATAGPVIALLKSGASSLFPPAMKAGVPSVMMRYAASKKFKPNGGWGDKRDHELCLSFVKE